MNNDLISREALKKALHNFFDGKVIDEPAYILRDVFCYIEGAPTVPQVTVFAENASKEEVADFKQELEKVLERPQGEWLKIGELGLAYKCNKCGEVDVVSTNFCSNCGADMRGKEE